MSPGSPALHLRTIDVQTLMISRFFFFLQFSSVVQCGVGVVSPVSAPSLIVVEGLRGQESFDKRHGGWCHAWVSACMFSTPVCSRGFIWKFHRVEPDTVSRRTFSQWMKGWRAGSGGAVVEIGGTITRWMVWGTWRGDGWCSCGTEGRGWINERVENRKRRERGLREFHQMTVEKLACQHGTTALVHV